MDSYLLEVIACPKSKEKLIYNKTTQKLIAVTSKLAYPIRDGVPIMIAEEASPLTDEELHALSSQSK